MNVISHNKKGAHLNKKFIIFVLVLLVLTSFTVSKDNEVFISSDVVSKAAENGKVDVIIKFREPDVQKGFGLLSSEKKSEAKKTIIKKEQEQALSTLMGDKGFRLKRQYKYVNSVAASVTQKELEKLKNHPHVEGIYYDEPVYTLLTESVPLINASSFWDVSINGLSTNGTGETVCVIDSGIDYTHPFLGGCMIGNYSSIGNIESLPQNIESAHPYPNGIEITYKVNYTGFQQISAHFVNISLQQAYDYIKVLEGDNETIIASYTDFHEDIWTPTVEGDTLYIRLETSAFTEDDGFIIDKVINGTINTTLNWSGCGKVIGGWDFYSGGDSDPRPDTQTEKHGTHVAGIVTSVDGSYAGVAPGTRIVAVRALGGADPGSGYSSDVDAGIEWCIENKDKYNISVITMSLGSTSTYTSVCDGESLQETRSAIVQTAISEGIFVVAASGNAAYTDRMSSPACLENVTSVGAVYDGNTGGWSYGVTCTDDGSEADNVTCFSNSASFLDLLAPGAIINSSVPGGEHELKAGTSQATPHVAGAAALLIEFKKRENGTILRPLQVRDILKNTGKDITDPRNSLVFPRINLSSALAYIDDIPRLTFVQVLANNSNISQNSTFVNITSSEPLNNATIDIDGTNKTMVGSNRNFYYNITDEEDGEHNFTIHIIDSTGNEVSSGIYAFDVDTTKPNITGVRNESLPTGFIVYFNTSEPAIGRIHYGTSQGAYDKGAVNTLEYKTKHNISITGLASNTTYYYVVNATDLVGNSNISEEFNYTTGLIDLTNPYWSNNSTHPPTTTTTHNKSLEYQFNVTWQDNIKISSVWVEHNFSGQSTNSSITGNKSTTYYFNISGIAAGKHFWKMYANDTSNNINFTDTFFYYVSRASSSVNLTLNGTQANRTINQTDKLNITANTTGDHTILLYVNGTLINSQTKSVNNLTTFNRKGLYNITAKYPLSPNYTASSRTLWVNVQDSLPPQVNITNPLNNTPYSSNPIVNVTTSESASCNYTINTGTNSTLASSNRVHTATLSLPDGIYNVTVLCEDTAGFVGRAEAVNFSIDTTSPVVYITYPTSNLRINSKSIQVNYTINETNLDSAWYILNHNITKIPLTPTDKTGGNNSQIINFGRAGKQVLKLYANDSAGRTTSEQVTFFINRTLNITNWIIDFTNIEHNITTIEVFNSTDSELSQNISLDQDVSLEINLTNTTMKVYNLSPSNVNWDYFFQVSDNSSYFESQITSRYGTEAVDYVYVTNFSLFLNDTTDYYGRIILPKNKTNSYGNIYYCSRDDLTDCGIIGVCSGDYTEPDTTACYNESDRHTYVYVPHFSAVFGDNDTLAPQINITSPSNNSVLTASYNQDIAFSTNENSTCKHRIDTGSWTNSTTTNYRDFTSTYDFNSNGDHNLTVNCIDTTGNLRSSQINFTVSDTTAPVISNLDDNDDTTTEQIKITFNTNEPANHTISMEGEGTERQTSFSLSHSETFTNLDEDTIYNYNITACDRVGNCVSDSDSKRTDEETSDEDDDNGGGSSGGSSGSNDDISAPTKVTQVYYSPEEGQHTMNIASTNIPFTHIIFTLNKQVNGTVLMNVEQRDLPSFIDSLPRLVYKYVKIDKSLIQDEDVSRTVIKFRVTKNWINNNNIDEEKIFLYRYTDDWSEVDTVKTNEDSTYVYYESDSPGLSYFGIRGDEAEIIPQEQEDDGPGQQTTGDVIKDVSQDDNPNQDSSQERKKFPWGILSIVLITLIVGGVVGFLLYQKNVSVLSDQELRELDEYVQKCKSEGIEFKHIKSTLLKVGWPEYIIDLVLHDVHIPKEDRKQLISYINKARILNKKDEDIRLALKKVGWQEEIIDEAFKKA